MNALPTRRTTFPSRPSVKPNRVAGAKSSCPGVRVRSRAATTDNGQRTTDNRGFTLVEMLVAIGILLILMVITIAAVNVTMDSDRITSGARSMQSFFEGARDRALFAGRPRGVRLLPDPNDPTLVTSILYIESPDPWPTRNFTAATGDPAAKVEIMNDGMGRPRAFAATSTALTTWTRLRDRGLLGNVASVMIGTAPRSYNLYTIIFQGGTWQLTKDYPVTGVLQDSFVFLAPAVLPNQEPRTLPRGIAIDLNQLPFPATVNTPPVSSLPSSVAATVGTGQPIDILFSPRGAVTGPFAGGETIHLRLVDTTDVNQAATTPAEVSLGRDEFLVSIRTQTGKVSTHPVNPARNARNEEIDPFVYAELGEGSSP